MIFIASEDQLTWNQGIRALYFYSYSSPSHRQIVSLVNHLEEKSSKIVFFAIDFNYFTVLGKRFEIVSVPTMIFLENSREVSRLAGHSVSTDLIVALDDIYSFRSTSMENKL